MIRACLWLLAGVYALQLSSFAADSDPGAIALAACLVVAVVRRPAVAWFCAGLAAFAAGSAAITGTRLPAAFEGDSIVVAVRVAGFPQRRGETVTFVAEQAVDPRLPRRMRLAWFQPPEQPRFGDEWRLELRLRRPRGGRNPGVFDIETWLFRSGVGATGYVVAGRRNELLATDRLGLTDRLRRDAVVRITGAVPGPREAAVLAAVTVGARHLVTREQWDAYARTGTSHLMAISGLHVGIVAAGAFAATALAGGFLARSGCHRARATVAALAAACAYAAISGLAVPAQRAVVMLALAALAALRRRQVLPMRVIAAACILLLLADPVGSLAPGFKLSFAAVVVLAWMARRRSGREIPGAPWRWLCSGARLAELQVVLLLGLAPLTVGLFSRVALASPWVNAFAVPVFSLITVPCAFAGLLMDGPLAGAGDALLRLAAMSLAVVHWLIDAAAAAPGAAILPARNGAAALLALVPVAWALLPRGWPGRYLGWLGLLAVLTWSPPRPATGCVRIDAIDAGQGLAVLAQTRRHTLLYDTGPAWRGGGSAMDAVVLPYLRGLGVVRVDTLVVSHADLDHAGGVAALRAARPVGTVLAGEPGTRGAVPCLADSTWLSDGVTFRFLHPAATGRAGNDASCVLSIEAGSHRLLLTGDIGKTVEAMLLESDRLEPAAAVVVPHHGSETSSSTPFVAALRPGIAIVAAGYRNRWGFPKPAVVERWRSVGARVLVTGESGAVTFQLCAGSGMESLRAHRDAMRRIWHE